VARPAGQDGRPRALRAARGGGTRRSRGDASRSARVPTARSPHQRTDCRSVPDPDRRGSLGPGRLEAVHDEPDRVDGLVPHIGEPVRPFLWTRSPRRACGQSPSDQLPERSSCPFGLMDHCRPLLTLRLRGYRLLSPGRAVPPGRLTIVLVTRRVLA
jgi:hypothetical protein